MTNSKSDTVRELTDEDVARLEKIPEIVETWERIRDIQSDYRWATKDLLDRHYGRGLPDVRRVMDKYQPELKKQRAIFRELIIKHL